MNEKPKWKTITRAIIRTAGDRSVGINPHEVRIEHLDLDPTSYDDDGWREYVAETREIFRKCFVLILGEPVTVWFEGFDSHDE